MFRLEMGERGGGGGGGGREYYISSCSSKATAQFFSHSQLSGVSLIKLKLSACCSFNSKFYGTLFWHSSNTFLALESLIGLFSNMAGDTFLTNGGDGSTQNPLASAIVQIIPKMAKNETSLDILPRPLNVV